LHGSNADTGRHNVEPGHVRTLRCRTVATGRLRQRHHIRDLEPTGSRSSLDQPGTLLNEDDEPHPSEMLLAALGACLSASIQANAVARGIPVRTLEVHTRGEVDPSALWGTGERRPSPLGFESIVVEVHVEADAPRAALKSLVDYAVLWSPVANTLHDPVHLDVVLVTE
jgi:uncharacterized OsmC-like protein